jgi:hypothetical protein
MKRVLGFFVPALVGGTLLVLAFGAGPASATHVQCGDTITQDTTLDSDLLNCPDDGLVIAADGVMLNLRGHLIDGDGFGGSGIEVEEYHSGFTITNGAVREFANAISLYEVEDGLVSGLDISRSYYRRAHSRSQCMARTTTY